MPCRMLLLVGVRFHNMPAFMIEAEVGSSPAVTAPSQDKSAEEETLDDLATTQADDTAETRNVTLSEDEDGSAVLSSEASSLNNLKVSVNIFIVYNSF